MTLKLLREIIYRTIQEEKSHIGAIYCDMDGVLVDFEVGAIELVSMILDGTDDSMWTRRSRSIGKNVKRVLNNFGYDWRPSSRSDLDIKDVRQILMSAISLSPGDFFNSLPPLEDGINDLWPFLNETMLPVHILSAPIEAREGYVMTATEGKQAWCERYLIPAPQSVIITKAVDKPSWAVIDGVTNILVDDKKKTIDEWNALGGIGILHTPGDSRASISAIRSFMRKKI